MTQGKILSLFFSALVAIGVIIYVGHEAGWWLIADSTNRQAQVNQNSYGFQQSRIEELHQDATTIATISAEVDSSPDPIEKKGFLGQGHAVLAQACAAASQVTNMPPDLASFVAKNCADGTVSPSSQYAA